MALLPTPLLPHAFWRKRAALPGAEFHGTRIAQEATI